MRFRGHTGHAFSQESFANGHGEVPETTLWHALRLLGERCALLLRFAQTAERHGGEATAAARMAEQAAELEQGIALLRPLLQQNGFRLPTAASESGHGAQPAGSSSRRTTPPRRP